MVLFTTTYGKSFASNFLVLYFYIYVYEYIDKYTLTGYRIIFSKFSFVSGPSPSNGDKSNQPVLLKGITLTTYSS